MKLVETESQRIGRQHCVKKVWPLFFWHKCVMCGHYFRRESMYEFATIRPMMFRLSYHNICKECAPDIAAAVEALKEYTSMTPPPKE